MFLKYLCARLLELFPFDPLTILIKSFPFYRWESEGLHHLLTQQIRARARVQSQTVHTLCHNIMLVDWSTEQALGIPLTIQMWKLDSERLINLVKVLQAISGLWSTSLEFYLVPTGSLDPQAALWQPPPITLEVPLSLSLSLSLLLDCLTCLCLPNTDLEKQQKTWGSGRFSKGSKLLLFHENTNQETQSLFIWPRK